MGSAESQEHVFQVFLGRTAGEAGPKFPSLEEALHYVNMNRDQGRFDILMPGGEWYARRKTELDLPSLDELGGPPDNAPS